jgi:hypothetical protein
MIRRTQRFVVFFFIMFNAILTFGQNVSGSLINPQSSEPHSGISILIENTEKQTETNNLGTFVFENVKSGTYNILAKINNQLFIVSTFTISTSDLDLGTIEFRPPSTSSFDDFSVIDIADLTGIEAENDNYSSALSAGRDPFVNATNFNLQAGRFRPRGYQNEDAEMYMNGMLMNDQDDGRVLWTAWNGLNDMIRTRTNLINLNESDFTFGGIGGATFIDLRASSIRNEKKVTYSHSNRTFQHRLMGSYATGMMQNGWAIAASASHSYGSQGFIKGTYMQGNSYFLSVDRKLNDKHLLNIVAFGSPQKRGRSSGAIQEMYDLADDNYYNPNWGYQNGQVRNSREYIIHQPVTMLRHDWKVSDKTNVMTTIGYQFGNYGSTRLDWYDAPDPRPDYYRRLPSFFTDADAKKLVTDYYTASEENRQLDWHGMYAANATRDYTIMNVNGIEGNNIRGKLAAYVQESENFDNKKFSFNSVINTVLTSNISLTGGLQYLSENVHYYRRLEDLLGADFYVDFNRFALRDFPTNPNAGQNDLNNPNRIVYVGDIYGHNYNINNQRASVWGQMSIKMDKFDYFASLSIASQSFYREGFTKVGLFPDNSFGKSEVHSFFNYAGKGGITYKLNGRNYFALNGSYRTRAPLANEVYISPRVRDQIASNVTNEKIAAFDVSYLARYTDFKARVSLFFSDFHDRIENNVFYHEEFRTFVNYLMTNIDRRHLGLEFGAEYKLTSKIELSAAGSVGEYYFTSRPLATISRDNSAEDFVKDRVIYTKNYFVPGSPQIAGTVGIRYQSTKFWNFNLNVNGFAKNYLSFNPDRRTEVAVRDILPSGDENSLYNEIIAQEKLPDGYTVDFSVGHSYRFKNASFLRVNLNVGNILNNTNFISGGFENARFDFEGKDVNRFPPRYFYAYGLNYNLNVAYVFPR